MECTILQMKIARLKTGMQGKGTARNAIYLHLMKPREDIPYKPRAHAVETRRKLPIEQTLK
jgi:hypothetical protein